MAYSPVTEGEAMPLTWTLVQDNGEPFPLTGATLELVWNPAPGQSSSLTRFVGGGSFNVQDPENGIAVYNLIPADTTGKAGQWTITPVATFAGGPRYGDPQRIVVRPAP